MKKGRRLGDPLGKVFTPLAISDGGPKEFEVARGVPGATRKVFGGDRLGG